MRWLNGIYVIAKKVADFTNYYHQGGSNMGEKKPFWATSKNHKELQSTYKEMLGLKYFKIRNCCLVTMLVMTTF